MVIRKFKITYVIYKVTWIMFVLNNVVKKDWKIIVEIMNKLFFHK